MKMRDFRSLREAITYGARLEQVIISERGSENRRGVIVRAVTHDEEFPEGDTKPQEDLTEIITRVCKQVLSQNAGDNPKLADENKTPGTSRMKRTPQNSPCHKCNKLGHWTRECPQKELQPEEMQGQHLNSKGTPLGGK